MKEMDENVNRANPEGRLDRLVDGELSEADRHELLLQFEHEPEGWRRCALAFLEAQCWKQELGLMARSPEPPCAEPAPSEAAVQPASAARWAAAGRWASWRQHLATALTMGACFLIALALGTGLRGWSSGSGHGPEGSRVQAAKQEVPLEAAQGGPSARPADPWEVVTLSADSPNGERQMVSIPAFRRDAVDENLLNQVPDVIPPQIQQAFEQAGHRVQQQQQIVPVQMDSGHRLMVPVKQVDIHFVGRGL